MTEITITTKDLKILLQLGQEKSFIKGVESILEAVEGKASDRTAEKALGHGGDTII
jgi:hypothetical protein